MKRLLRKINYAIWLFERTDLNWEDKYSKIFGLGIWQSCRVEGVGYNWSDPDTSYREDVEAYMNQVVIPAREIIYRRRYEV